MGQGRGGSEGKGEEGAVKEPRGRQGQGPGGLVAALGWAWVEAG